MTAVPAAPVLDAGADPAEVEGAKARPFYEKTLGLPMQGESPVACAFRAGGVLLRIIAEARRSHGSRTPTATRCRSRSSEGPGLHSPPMASDESIRELLASIPPQPFIWAEKGCVVLMEDKAAPISTRCARGSSRSAATRITRSRSLQRGVARPPCRAGRPALLS